MIGEVFNQPPIFNGEIGDAGFPKDQESLVCALWKLNHARLMLQVKHEDADLPIRLCLVINPDEGREKE
jgi:hypothetical protein